MNEELMNIVIAGHVDHGKSTIIGRLLADTNSIPSGKIEQIKATCRRQSKPFEYAFLLDALKDEQSQGITIDIARCFFKTKQRKYLILDAPGHVEFLKNMITGAARAEAALLVIDVHEGIQENSKRHAYMLKMLGINQIVVLVNKMDMVNYQKNCFDQVVNDFEKFLTQLNIMPIAFVPTTGKEGAGIAFLNSSLQWYHGSHLLDILDSFKKEKPLTHLPFRMPIQDIYRFTEESDARRIIAGKIESGSIAIGDEITFYPSGKTSVVKSIESFNSDIKKTVQAGYSIGLILNEQIYVTRGEIGALSNELQPHTSSRFRVSLFWLGKTPLSKDHSYFLKLATTKTKMKVEQIIEIIDASSLSNKQDQKAIQRHEVGECDIILQHPIAFDIYQNNPLTSRFVIIEDYDIVGGGIIREALKDENEAIIKNTQKRNNLWISSGIPREERYSKYQQKPSILLITGQAKTGRKKLAKALEKVLFKGNQNVYYFGLGNIVHGIDVDIDEKNSKFQTEHIRRFAEVLNILLDAGVMVIATALELSQADVDMIQTITSCEKIVSVWLGNKTTDIKENLFIPKLILDNHLLQIKKLLNG